METKQSGIRFDKEALMKLKYMAWFELSTVTEIVTSEMDNKIKAWEKKHGAITPELIANAKIK